MTILKTSQIAAAFSEYDDTIMVYDEKDGSEEKKNSFLITADITASINEDTLASMQKKVKHSVNLFSEIKKNPKLIEYQNYDILFASSADLLTPET